MTVILWGFYILSLLPLVLLSSMKPQLTGWSILLFQICLFFMAKMQLMGLSWDLDNLVIALLFINVLIAITEFALIAIPVSKEAENNKNQRASRNK